MPGVYQLSVDEAVARPRRQADGVPGVLLFGLPEERMSSGSTAYDPEGRCSPQSARSSRKSRACSSSPTSCLCEYTSHGHCGIIVDDEIANDVTVEQLARAALSHAVAGADVVAPSDMMDGRVGAHPRGAGRCAVSRIRRSCRTRRSIVRRSMDHFVKPPIRRPRLAIVDRTRMDPANVEEALREVAIDIEEGADIVMVKPALAVSRRHRAGEGGVRISNRCLPCER